MLRASRPGAGRMGSTLMPQQPDILLVVVDALRAPNLGAYEYQRLTSPFLDSIAARSSVFDAAFAPNPPTEPSLTTLLSGVDALTHGVFAMEADASPPSDLDSLPRALARAGYQTVMVSPRWPWTEWIAGQFQQFRDSSYVRRIPLAWRKAERTTSLALEALRDLDADRPAFVVAHYLDTHTPYLPPPPYDRLFYPGEPGREFDPVPDPLGPRLARSIIPLYQRSWIGFAADPEWVVAQYDGAIRYFDSWLQVLVEAFERRTGREAVVVVTADHGEVLLENDESMFEHVGLRAPVLRIPLIVRTPGATPRRVGATALTQQIAGTLAALGGAAWADAHPRPVLPDGVDADDTPFISTYATRYFELAIQAGGTKYLERLRADGSVSETVTVDAATDVTCEGRPGSLPLPAAELDTVRARLVEQRSRLNGTREHSAFEAWRWSKPEGAAIVAARLARLGYEEEGPVDIDAEGNVKNELLRWRDIAEGLSTD